jgi:hypothetical protein
MLAKKLIEHFRSQTKLHVLISDVTARVRSLAIGQRIEFFPSIDQPDVLRGMINQWEVTLAYDAEPVIVNEIHYNPTMDKSWQRVVVCKEMIHILDPTNLLTSTLEHIRELMERISRPLDLQMIYNGQECGDRVAEFLALAVLFPAAVREILMAPYKAGTLTASEIAKHAEIPERYIPFIMSEQWDHCWVLLTKFLDSEEDTIGENDG